MATRLEAASKTILRHFGGLKKVLLPKDIQGELSKNREIWRLKQSQSLRGFIDFLSEQGELKYHKFNLPHRPFIRYTWGEVPLEEIVQSFYPDGYFSHFYALHHHALTDQVPKSIYFNHEQHLSGGGGSLTQEGIDRAFEGNCKVTNNICEVGDRQVFVLNGRNTGRLGVERMNDLSKLWVTDTERTLIDVAVRPVYSGGISVVAQAYAAAGGNISVNRVVSYLAKLNYTYPYHQVIGYYMDRSGEYSSSQLDMLRKLGIQYKFYLDYAIEEPKLNREWNLIVPKGF